jgi:hypothetical protein
MAARRPSGPTRALLAGSTRALLFAYTSVTWTNILRRNAYCRPLASDASDFISLSYPGTANLGFTQKGNFNDKIHSYQCFETVVGNGGVEV